MTSNNETDDIRQHGAMEFSTAPVDLDKVRKYRLQCVRSELIRKDYAAIILFDPVNIRYATDVANMQVWCMHNENRYVFIPAEGPVILFEAEKGVHLAEDISTVDEIYPAQAWYYFASGSRYKELASNWATSINELILQHCGNNRRVAVDRAGYTGLKMLEDCGITVLDGFEVMEHAREIKSSEEIELMRCAIDVCEKGIGHMRNALVPGITENELWSVLHKYNIQAGGEWIETRLLSSGPRTNPWYREASHREIKSGDIVAFDTDLIGPYGYCADISRSWVCGENAASTEQQQLHAIACEQLDHNMSLIKAGVSLREIAEKAWPIPDEYLNNRYSCIGHGVGMCDEYPSIYELVDYKDTGYDDILKANTVLCIESYIGKEGGREGIKLEEQILVTEDGVEKLSSYPLDLM